jgi:hypothetical protein
MARPRTIALASCSPDINPCDYFLLSSLKDHVYINHPPSITYLKSEIHSHWKYSTDIWGRQWKFPCSYNANAEQTGRETLEEHRMVSWLCVLLKAYTGRWAWEAIGDRFLRPYYLSREDPNRKIRTRKQRTDISKYSFINRTIINWNQLPADLYTCMYACMRDGPHLAPAPWPSLTYYLQTY